MKARRLSGAALMLVTACTEPPPEPSVAKQAIHGGTFDDGTAACPLGTLAQPPNSTAVGCFPEVVQLRGQATGGGVWNCSGTLISPRVVVFAHHCLEPAMGGTSADFVVRVGPDWQNPLFTGTHENAASGDVIVPGCPTCWPGGLSDEEASRDLAIALLDEPIPRTVAVPRARPSFEECAPGFTGTLVGHGYGSFGVVDDQNLCGNQHRLRRFNTSIDDWFRGYEPTPSFNGTQYSNTWVFPMFAPCEYYGAADGDSGGALIDEAGRLCGVIGSVRPFPNVPWAGFWMVWNLNAGLDSAGAVDLVLLGTNSQGLGATDPKGNPTGECAKHIDLCDNWGKCSHAEQDVDGDDVWDSCDSCKTVYNPDQLVSHDDTDHNGIGASCDACPGASYTPGPTDDCNYEVSVAAGWPTLAHPPLISGPPQSPAEETQLNLDIYKLLSKVKPNACDAVACPAQARVPGELAASVLPPFIDCLSDPANCNCVSAGLGGSCEWKTTGHKIEIRPRTNPQSGHAVNTPVKVGTRWCKCDEQIGTGSMASRAACRATCPMTASAYDSSPNWKAMATSSSYAGPFVVGAEPATQLKSYATAAAQLERYWDFRPLAEMYGETKHFQDDPERAIVSWRVHGIVMTKIVEVSGQPVTASHLPEYHERAMTFGYGDGWLRAVENPPSTSIPVADDWFLAIFCPDCPIADTFLGKELINPATVATMGGAMPSLQDASALDEVFAAALDGAVQVIPASEALGSLAAATLTGTSMLRAVVFNPAEGGVVSSLESTELDALPMPYTTTAGTPPTLLTGNEGLALSGSLRRLVVVGGTDDGTPSGEPNGSAWLIDVDRNEWTELPLDGYRPGHVLDAAFRVDDLRVYLVGWADGRLFLWRYLPRGTIEPIAMFPESWGAFERSWLVVGDGGDLVFAASSADPPASLVARFSMDGGGLSFNGSKELDTEVVGRPLATRYGIHAVLLAADLTHLEVIDNGVLYEPEELPEIF